MFIIVQIQNPLWSNILTENDFYMCLYNYVTDKCSLAVIFLVITWLQVM
jgi:hypothetical protein